MNKKVLLAAALALLFAVAAFASRAAPGQEDAAPQQERAADFTVYAADGSALRLSDCAGQPVLINFWASWCPPCRAELPFFDAAYRAYGGAIRFLMVDLTDGAQETKASADALVAENGYRFPLYYDTDASAAEAYRLTAIPQTVAVDAEGRLLATHTGALTEEALAALIDKLLP